VRAELEVPGLVLVPALALVLALAPEPVRQQRLRVPALHGCAARSGPEPA